MTRPVGCHTFFTSLSPLRCRRAVERDMQTRTIEVPGAIAKPVVLKVAGDEWQLFVCGVTPADSEFFVELEVVGPSVCRVLVRTRRMVRGETARQMLDGVPMAAAPAGQRGPRHAGTSRRGRVVQFLSSTQGPGSSVVEHLTFNQRAAGSIPARVTTLSIGAFVWRQVIEKWCGYDGSIQPISVVRNPCRKEQQLQTLLVVERRLHQEV